MLLWIGPIQSGLEVRVAPYMCTALWCCLGDVIALLSPKRMLKAIAKKKKNKKKNRDACWCQTLETRLPRVKANLFNCGHLL